MREITKVMIKDFHIMKLGYDFMGYVVKNKNDLSFHHMIVPKRDSKRVLGNDGYVRDNGSILVQETSHDYLHTIERVDRELFDLITQEMIKENMQGRIDIDNLKRIRDYLLFFEKEHCGDRNTNKKLVIKPQYVEKRIQI